MRDRKRKARPCVLKPGDKVVKNMHDDNKQSSHEGEGE